MYVIRPINYFKLVFEEEWKKSNCWPGQRSPFFNLSSSIIFFTLLSLILILLMVMRKWAKIAIVVCYPHQWWPILLTLEKRSRNFDVVGGMSLIAQTIHIYNDKPQMQHNAQWQTYTCSAINNSRVWLCEINVNAM